MIPRRYSQKIYIIIKTCLHLSARTYRAPVLAHALVAQRGIEIQVCSAQVNREQTKHLVACPIRRRWHCPSLAQEHGSDSVPMQPRPGQGTSDRLDHVLPSHPPGRDELVGPSAFRRSHHLEVAPTAFPWKGPQAIGGASRRCG